MKPDQKRVSALLVQTVSLLCKNGLHYDKGLHIQGLLGITVDDGDVFIVQIDDKLFQKSLANEQINPDNRKTLKNESECTNKNKIKSTIRQHSSEIVPVNVHGSCSFDTSGNSVLVDGDVTNTEQKVQFDDEESPSKFSAVDDEDIIFVKSEINEDVDENTDQPNIEQANFVNESHKSYDDQYSTVDDMQDGTSSFKNEDNFALIPVNQRRSYPPANDYLMQQQYTNGALAKVSSPAIYDGQVTSFKDQSSSSSYSENFPHLSTSQEMIKESWTYTKYKQTTHHPNNSQIIAANNASSLMYNKTQSNPSSSSFRGSGELLSINAIPRRRSSIKTVVCQYPDCGKTFCHSCHLYRHQRLKHGRRFGVVAQTSFGCQFPGCGKVFYRKASLINHNFVVHGLGPQPSMSVVVGNEDEDDVNMSFG